MSYGKMNTFIEIIDSRPVIDAEGFSHASDTILASVRAYKEDRHGSEAWRNRAAFSNASALFRFRVITDLTLTTAHVIVTDEGRYNILSVDDVRGRGMYLEVLAEEVKPSHG